MRRLILLLLSLFGLAAWAQRPSSDISSFVYKDTLYVDARTMMSWVPRYGYGGYSSSSKGNGTHVVEFGDAGPGEQKVTMTFSYQVITIDGKKGIVGQEIVINGEKTFCVPATVTVQIGEKETLVDASGFLVEGNDPYLPLRFFATAFNATLAHHAADHVVTLTHPAYGSKLIFFLDPKDAAAAQRLVQAVKGGDLAKTRAMLDASPKLLQARTEIDRTLLHLAAAYNKVDIANLLLARGLDVNSTASRGTTALHHGAANLVMARLLIEKGADVNTGNQLVGTPLHNAVDAGQLAVVKLFLEHNANPNVLAYMGRTIDHEFDARDASPLQVAVAHNRRDIAELLLQHGADVNATGSSRSGGSPLELAMTYANLDMVKLILQYNPSLAPRPEEMGYTLLHVAADRGNIEYVRLLVERGMDVNATAEDGTKPLDLATDKKVADYLRQHGATRGRDI